MNILSKAAVTAGMTALLVAGSSTAALAHYCINESNDANKNVAWVLVSDLENFDIVDISSNVKFTRGGMPVGAGFYDLYFDDGDGVKDEGDALLGDNIFLHAGLPVSALTAAGCDQGVATAIWEEFGIPDPCV